ncbi:MAG TPA: aminotransferase class I/II-fold pyridoxal phosphate-dependent enzyme [Thermoanaerobaculia bacterium]|nr:aminotransferase class I/II-fold pyridoxal phosphate-dependent enzyme [Thermoanaerobaculia bacterium]
MPNDRFLKALEQELAALDARGNPKRNESVIVGVEPAAGGLGPRYLLAGEGAKRFLKMNSNNYLGMNLRPEIVAAEEAASKRYGAGPGAVRFISGTYEPHVALEAKLARFHGREAAMIFSSAYAAMIGTFVPLVTGETALVSDELNHNCIINAIKLARPKEKRVYKHNDVADFEAKLAEVACSCQRALVVTDGIFSMRGDHAPLAELCAVARRHDAEFPENVVMIVDDSHGVGAYGPTGRGTEEQLGVAGGADVLVGTLGKAFGVNGGYVVGARGLVDFLRETAPMYIYSNPITPAEAAAALAAVELLDGAEGPHLIAHLRAMTKRFRDGLGALGLETLPGEHPVVPLFVRDTPKTVALVRHLRAHGILATGLSYPVVPKGNETIRFQISVDHTPRDVDYVLETLASFSES